MSIIFIYNSWYSNEEYQRIPKVEVCFHYTYKFGTSMLNLHRRTGKYEPSYVSVKSVLS